MKDRICHYKYNSTETEQIELHLVRTHLSGSVSWIRFENVSTS